MKKYISMHCDINILYIPPIGEFIPLPKPVKIESLIDYNQVTANVEWLYQDIGSNIQLLKSHNLFIFYKIENNSIQTEIFECMGIEYTQFSMSSCLSVNEDSITFRFRRADDSIFKSDPEFTNRVKKVYDMSNRELARMLINSTYGLPRFIAMPRIKEVFYTEPYTTVKWLDGTTTTVKCKDGYEFNKEIGVAMAITRKYFESMPVANPRGSFKEFVYKKSVDQTKTVHDRKARNKKKKLERLKALEESNKEISDGDISTSKKSSS